MRDIATIEQELAAAEAQVPNLRKGCHKRIIWAGEPATKSQLVLLYIHGFSASPNELRPLPDMIAAEFGANIHFTRLTGHGRDGPAMASATFSDWQADMEEAIQIAQTIGDEIVIMGCSTGCTMATVALAKGLKAKAAIFMSPNFGLRSRIAQWVLDAPWSSVWGPIVAGQTRSFDPINEGHAAYWTTTYPTQAVMPMGDAMRAVRRVNLGLVSTPAFVSFSENDQVVHPKDIRATMARWGGQTTVHLATLGPNDDENEHVTAGDVFSPSQTEAMAQRIAAWLKSL